MIESFILKLNLLSTDLTDNCIEKMCLECRKSDATDRTILWGFEIVCSSHRVDGK